MHPPSCTSQPQPPTSTHRKISHAHTATAKPAEHIPSEAHREPPKWQRGPRANQKNPRTGKKQKTLARPLTPRSPPAQYGIVEGLSSKRSVSVDVVLATTHTHTRYGAHSKSTKDASSNRPRRCRGWRAGLAKSPGSSRSCKGSSHEQGAAQGTTHVALEADCPPEAAVVAGSESAAGHTE